MALIDIGSESATSETFSSFLDQLRNRLDVDHAAYAGMDQGGGDIRGFVTYPDQWIEHYRANDLANCDPTLKHAARSIAPLDWSRIPKLSGHDRFLDHAVAFGIPRNGVTIPVRGPYGDLGMLIVSAKGSDDQWRKQYRSIIHELQSAAVYIHDNVVRTFTHQYPATRPLLSHREVETLQWSAAGKTNQDIGVILGISDRTVEIHLKSARTKLGALNTAQAVARAISRRLIEPEL